MNLLQFETIFMTERQVAKCKDMFARKIKSSNPIFLAWKVFKAASLPMEKVALEAVIQSHTPQNIPKRKARSGRNVPQGASRFNPISDDWTEIMKETLKKKSKEPVVKISSQTKKIKEQLIKKHHRL